MVAPVVDAADLAGEGVDPRHRVLEVARGGVDVEELAQGAERARLLDDEGTGDGGELYFGRGDEPGEAEAAYRRGEKRIARRTFLALAVGAKQFEPADVPAEGPRPRVVLSMDVVGDGAAHRDHLRAGDAGDEEPARQRDGEEACDRHPRLAADPS